jgi:4-hydroxybenzoate polyprenyltransferase
MLAARLRVLLALCRPALVLLFALVVSLGVAQGGRPGAAATVAAALVPVLGFLVFAVAVNDLHDVDVDGVNLPGDRGRPLVAGFAGGADMVAAAGAGAVVAVVGAALIHPIAVAVVTGGLAFATVYSRPPVRLAGRGILAPLTLPLAFVAVPYLVGILAARGSLRAEDLGMLLGLYIAFVGRLVLKDLRDVRGDALFGKRTFLVRHGRRAAVVVAGSAWVAGTAVLAVVTTPSPAQVAVLAGLGALTLGVFVALDRSRSARRDEALVAAAALVGRGTLVVLLAHLSMRALAWSAAAQAVTLLALGVVTAGLAVEMARTGPVTRRGVPVSWVIEQSAAPADERGSRPSLALASTAG